MITKILAILVAIAEHIAPHWSVEQRRKRELKRLDKEIDNVCGRLRKANAEKNHNAIVLLRDELYRLSVDRDNLYRQS